MVTSSVLDVASHDHWKPNWQRLQELLESDSGLVVVGADAVSKASKQRRIDVIFVPEGTDPMLEALLPTMRNAGVVCHVIASNDPAHVQYRKLGVAAILDKPFPAASTLKRPLPRTSRGFPPWARRGA